MQASLGLCYLAQLRGFMCVVVVLCPQHLTLPSLEATLPLKKPTPPQQTVFFSLSSWKTSPGHTRP